MIDERGNAIAIDHMFAIDQSKKICSRGVLVDVVGLRVREPRPGVFSDDRPLLDWRSGIYAIGVNLGLPDYQCHVSRLALRSRVASATQCG
jgi:hypothetical protein